MRGLAATTAVVTGANRGIGKGIALRLLAEGVRVVAVSRTKSSAEDFEGASQGVNFWSFPADLSDPAAVTAVAKTVVDTVKTIDILVNNAGITSSGIFMRTPLEEMRRLIDTDLLGPALLTQAFMRPLIASKRGRVINIGSIIGVTGGGGQVLYAAVKSALSGFTKALAREYASKGVTANLICPGLIETDMTATLPPDKIAEYLKEIPLGRQGGPADVACWVALFASEEAGYTTGQVICVDGGLAM